MIAEAVRPAASRRRFLVPVDGSRGAQKALDHVLRQPGLESARVELVYVHEVPPFYENAAAYLRRPANRRFAAQCARAALGPAAGRLARAGVAHRESVRYGDAAPEIARAAARLGCESVVMGSRGLGPVRSLVLGSTATKVIHLATVPVTIVK